MKRAPGSTMRTTPAGPRLRCFLGLVAAAAIVLAPATTDAQGNCVAPHGVAIGQIRGQVYDAFGLAVPFATITVLGIRGAVQTTADATGQFSFDVPPGHYVLKAESEGFAYSSAELKVGRSWQTTLGRQRLKVMLGFGDTYCPWVTTSKKDFEDTSEANFTRLKESAQIKDVPEAGDTSKAKKAPQTKQSPPAPDASPAQEAQPKKEASQSNDAAPSKGASQTNDIPQTKDTPESKETSQTNATQK
ncbi:MAG TPA: carboxypeptidase regulatory-like domain-containing protein [Terracidiphilus sp.]|nr:carboxypeptidase regulatory-like domain-containing protein [Terracidiphilus sp.]